MKFPMKSPVMVNELIAALLEFPPNAEVSVSANFMQDAELTVDNTVVLDS